MSSFHVLALQLTSGESVKDNVDQVLQILSDVPTSTNVDLICLPENSLYFHIGKKKRRSDIHLDDHDLMRLQKFVDDRNWAMMLGSIPVKDGDRSANATVFLEPGKPPRVPYRKIHLFDVEVPGAPAVRESEVFRHGQRPAILEWHGWRIGLSICYDLRFAELYSHYSDLGVDLILVPSAFLVPTGKAHWEILLRARAIENQCYLVAAAQGGEHVNAEGEKRHTYGHTMVIGPWGEKLAEITGEDRLADVMLEKSEIEKVRRQIPMRQHRSERAWEA